MRARLLSAVLLFALAAAPALAQATVARLTQGQKNLNPSNQVLVTATAKHETRQLKVGEELAVGDRFIVHAAAVVSVEITCPERNRLRFSGQDFAVVIEQSDIDCARIVQGKAKVGSSTMGSRSEVEVDR